MLRITCESETAEEVVLRLEGWLTGTDVTLLEREGSDRLRHSERLVLDLTQMKFIDEAGLSLLKTWPGDRMVLRGGSKFVRALMAEHGLESWSNCGTAQRKPSE